MAHDDYYDYDPYWDDSKRAKETDCIFCGKAEEKCSCDDDFNDFDIFDEDYL